MEPRATTRNAPSPKSLDTTPAQVDAWVAALPLVNLGESSRLVFGALIETNAVDIPTDQRFHLLESLAKPVRVLCEGLKSSFVGKPFPLSEKARQISKLSQTLLVEMAAGYRIVMEESGDKRGPRHDNGRAMTAAYRALSNLGEALLRAYQVYATYPPGLWQQVHALYLEAETKGFAQSPIKEVDGGPGSSIENIYKRILLLALACPYRLRQGEVEQVYGWLRDWAQHSSLEKLSSSENPNGMFVANLASDDPPTYLVLRDAEYDAASCRLLNVTHLAEVMRDVNQPWRAEDHKIQTMNHQVLRRLMLAWGVMPKRRFSRAQKHSTALVATGLSAAHYFISGEVAFDNGEGAPCFSSRAHFEASETADHLGSAPDVWEIAGTYGRDASGMPGQHAATQDFANPSNASNVSSQAAVSPSYQARVWKMVNVSAGGYRLLWDSDESSQAQVGELLGLRESSDPDSFHLALGVVRWMKHSAEMGLELGVEMLSPGAVAVGVKPDKASIGGDYQRSLLLPAIKSIGQPATLLTPALPYHLGDVLMVNSHGKEARVELTKLVENTGTFAQYQFRPLESRAADAPDRASGTRPVPDFSDLWKSL